LLKHTIVVILANIARRRMLNDAKIEEVWRQLKRMHEEVRSFELYTLPWQGDLFHAAFRRRLADQLRLLDLFHTLLDKDRLVVLNVDVLPR